MGGEAKLHGREESLVKAAQAGDESAFAWLVEQYRWELQIHCYRLLGSLDESEDLTQETFLRAWRGRESFAGRSTFRAWLYGIATNACLDALARRPPVLPVARAPTRAGAPMDVQCTTEFSDTGRAQTVTWEYSNDGSSWQTFWEISATRVA